MADLEGGIAAVLTASGTAALNTALLIHLRFGNHIVASSNLYGGTYNLLSVTLPRFGITTTFVDPSEVENFSKAAKENTRALLIKSLGNPKLDILDIEKRQKWRRSIKYRLFLITLWQHLLCLIPLRTGQIS